MKSKNYAVFCGSNRFEIVKAETDEGVHGLLLIHHACEEKMLENGFSEIDLTIHDKKFSVNLKKTSG